jgi:hypothetical protein
MSDCEVPSPTARKVNPKSYFTRSMNSCDRLGPLEESSDESGMVWFFKACEQHSSRYVRAKGLFSLKRLYEFAAALAI